MADDLDLLGALRLIERTQDVAADAAIPINTTLIGILISTLH